MEKISKDLISNGMNINTYNLTMKSRIKKAVMKVLMLCV